MKQKINLRLIGIAILAVFVTTISITWIYYGLFQEQVRHDLRVEAQLLKESGLSHLVDQEEVMPNEDVRITWIGEDGSVLFDNAVDEEKLSNHKNRPEVKNAFLFGEGESIRKSDTMNMKIFYYALLLEDGTVLRISSEARSIFSVFLSTFPIAILIIGIIIVVCIFLSHLLTRQLLAPIENLAENLDDSNVFPEYKELVPFVNRIRDQHENILQAANSRQDFTANVSHELKTPITAISALGHANTKSAPICLEHMEM